MYGMLYRSFQINTGKLGQIKNNAKQEHGAHNIKHIVGFTYSGV